MLVCSNEPSKCLCRFHADFTKQVIEGNVLLHRIVVGHEVLDLKVIGLANVGVVIHAKVQCPKLIEPGRRWDIFAIPPLPIHQLPGRQVGIHIIGVRVAQQLAEGKSYTLCLSQFFSCSSLRNVDKDMTASASS